MENKVQFLEKLAGLLEYCENKGNEIEKREVEAYFAGDQLSEEQMILVFDYLLAKKVLVKQYMKAGELFEQAEEKMVSLTDEEVQYLKVYEADIRSVRAEDVLSRMLPKVVEIAKRMNHEDIFIGDLIQEGNMGLMSALSKGEEGEDHLLLAIRESMQLYLKSQTDMKLQDRKMADKVNELEENIKKLTEEMGRKITIDELSHFTDISEEEIEDILKLAGEEIGETREE